MGFFFHHSFEAGDGFDERHRRQQGSKENWVARNCDIDTPARNDQSKKSRPEEDRALVRREEERFRHYHV
jgi:hypothetical protein